MTAQTPIYGIKYLELGQPARDTRLVMEDNAKTIEAALALGGIAPPAAQDLAALAGRVNVLETAPTAWTDLPLLGAPTLAHFPLSSQAGVGPTPQKAQYRIHQGRVWLRGWATSSGGFAAGGGTGANPLLSQVLPAGARPPVTFTLAILAASQVSYRIEVSPSGQWHSAQAVPASSFLCFDGLFWPLT